MFINLIFGSFVEISQYKSDIELVILSELDIVDGYINIIE